MIRLLVNLHRSAVVAAIAIALCATGFAHRLPSVQDTALVAALEVWGSSGDFCGTDSSGRAHHPDVCLACQVIGSALLPPLADAALSWVPPMLVKVSAPRENRSVVRVLDVSRASQGPPAA
jgi:hypothetical protein